MINKEYPNFYCIKKIKTIQNKNYLLKVKYLQLKHLTRILITMMMMMIHIFSLLFSERLEVPEEEIVKVLKGLIVIIQVMGKNK